jgi:hypothetical protein
MDGARVLPSVPHVPRVRIHRASPGADTLVIPRFIPPEIGVPMGRDPERGEERRYWMNDVDKNKKARRKERRGESIALPARLHLVRIRRELYGGQFGIGISARRRTPRTVYEHRGT